MIRYEHWTVTTRHDGWVSRLDEAGKEGFRIVSTVSDRDGFNILVMERKVRNEPASS